MKPRTLKDRDLEVLEAIDRRADINQRSLARETSMALGLVNSCLRRLMRKGMIKVREAPGRRYLYYLTPQGFSEKSRLTYEYIHYSVHFYSEARQRCRALFARLSEEGAETVALLGRSDLAEIAYITMQEFDLRFAGIYDEVGDGDEEFLGHRVRPIEALTRSRDGIDRIVYTRLKTPLDDENVKMLDFVEIF